MWMFQKAIEADSSLYGALVRCNFDVLLCCYRCCIVSLSLNNGGKSKYLSIADSETLPILQKTLIKKMAHRLDLEPSGLGNYLTEIHFLHANFVCVW